MARGAQTVGACFSNARHVAELVDAPKRTFPDATTWNPEQVRQFFAVPDGDDLAALWRTDCSLSCTSGRTGGPWMDVQNVRMNLRSP
jgi:hypothetical protein